MPVQLLTSGWFVPAGDPGRWLARRKAPTSFGGVSPYRCATGACKVAVRASTLAFCAAVGSTPPRREHLASPAKRMAAGEVPGMGLPAADRPALPLELDD